MTPIVPFLTYLEQAKRRMDEAPDAKQLDALFRRDDGVLHGYFLAGAVSVVEANAAHHDLQRVYEAQAGMFDLRAEWKRRHGDSA